jgi:hypothetical protein
MQSGLGDETNTHSQCNQHKLPSQYDEGEYVDIAPKVILACKSRDRCIVNESA